HVQLDLLTKIVREHGLRAEEIDEVIVRIPPAEFVRGLFAHDDPASPIDGQFSLPYALSMVAAGLPPGPTWQRPEHFTHPTWKSFASKIRPEVNPAWHEVMIEQLQTEGTYRRIPSEVVVRAGERTWMAYGEYPRGDPSTAE